MCAIDDDDAAFDLGQVGEGDQVEAQAPAPAEAAVGAMAQFGRQLAAAGWPIIPIIPPPQLGGGNGKEAGRAPGEYLGAGRWSGLPGWRSFGSQPPGADTLARWVGMPGAGVGLVCGGEIGRLVVVDIDADQPAMAGDVDRMAVAHLGETPFVRIGRAPRRVLLYRLAAGEVMPRTRKVACVDLLAAGNQVVGFGVHYRTGRPYFWPDASPLDCTPADLPEITVAQLEGFLSAVAAAYPPQCAGGAAAELPLFNAGTAGVGTSEKGRSGAFEAVESALEYLPNDGSIPLFDDHAAWAKMAYALAGALGDDGRNMFLDWSRQHDSFDEKQSAATWRSALSGGTSAGAGTIFAWARAQGWICPPHLLMNENSDWVIGGGSDQSSAQEQQEQQGQQQAEDQPQPAANAVVVGDIADDEYDRVSPDEQRILDLIAEAGGTIAGLTKWITDTATSPQPVAALGAAISAVAIAAGRRYEGPTGMRTNLQVAAIARSSSGKDYPLQTLIRLLEGVGLGDRLADLPGSRAGFHDLLQDHPCRLIALDEAGALLREMYNSKQTSTLTQVARELRIRFSDAKGTMRPPQLSKRDGKEERLPIISPHVSVYATSTPGAFASAFSAESLADGSAPRWLIFESMRSYPFPNPEPDSWAAPPSVLAGIVDIATHGRTRSTTMQAQEHPDIIRIGWGAIGGDARAMFHDMRVEETLRKRAIEKEGGRSVEFRVSVAGRRSELALRLAALRALSESPLFATVTTADLDWGRRLADWCAGRFVRLVADAASGQGETPAERAVAAVEAVIFGAGAEWTPHSVVTRRTERLSSLERQQALETLLAGERIVARKEPGKGRTPTYYRPAQYGPATTPATRPA